MHILQPRSTAAAWQARQTESAQSVCSGRHCRDGQAGVGALCCKDMLRSEVAFCAGALATVVVHGPAVCLHCILTAQLQPGRKPRRDSLDKPELEALFRAVKQWESWLDACETSAPEGFIAAKRTGVVQTQCILGAKQALDQ